MSIDINPDEINKNIEKFIGAEIPKFDPSTDPCVKPYNFFKPAILYFFYLCNHANTNEEKIIEILEKIKTQKNDVLVKASEEPAKIFSIPPTSENYTKTIYNEIFNAGEQYKPSIIIQGGEAVNFYTHYKYENVPTHDVDTRLLIGNYFTYDKLIASEVPPEAKLQMHKFRFFVSVGLTIQLKEFFDSIKEKANEGDIISKTYMETFFGPDYNSLTITVENNLIGYSFEFMLLRNKLEENPWFSIDNPRYLERLINIEINGLPDADDGCGIVDIFCPCKRSPNDSKDTHIGQSKNLFSYFSTAQSFSNVEGVLIPSFDFPLKISPNIPLLGNKDIQIRLIPYGYTLFDQLRMMFVYQYFESLGFPTKYLKYKQKLNVLLSTALDKNISAFIISECLGKKSNNKEMEKVLLGGRVAIDVQRPQLNTIVYSKPSAVEPIISRKAKAKEYSKSLLNEEIERIRILNKILQEEKEKNIQDILDSYDKTNSYPSITSLDEDKKLGYMDFLSYLYPDFKDFRLSSSTKSKTGGYRHKTLKKKKYKARRTTLRK